MLDLDAISGSFQALQRRKLRTLATVFGIFWGSLIFVLLLGAGNGFQNGFNREVARFAANSFFLWAQPTSRPYEGTPKGKTPRLTGADAAGLRASIAGLERLAPRIRCPLSDLDGGVVRGGKSGSFQIYGDVPDLNVMDKAEITAGRFLIESDLRELRKVVVIGDNVRAALFSAGEHPVGQTLLIKNTPYTVVGVERSLRAMAGDDRNDSIHMPFPTAQQAFHMGDAVHWFAAVARAELGVAAVEKRARAYLARRHRVDPEDSAAFGSFDLAAHFHKFTAILDGIRMLAWIVGLGTVLSGMVAITNIMLMTVKERTREIGIRRALGANPATVLVAILVEALILTSVSGAAGLVAGTGFLSVAGDLVARAGDKVAFFTAPQISFASACQLLLLFAGVGVMAALLPAGRALAIRPTEALKENA